MPPYDEFSVGRMLKEVKSDETVLRYLNMYEDSNDLPDREYLFTVIGTLYPDYLENLIREANNLRNRGSLEESKEEMILVRQDLL